MRFLKLITPSHGNYLGELYDGAMLIHDKEYSSYTVAEQALDALIREMLIDLFEQGLLDDLSAVLEAEGVTSMHLPSWPVDVEYAPVAWPDE